MQLFCLRHTWRNIQGYGMRTAIRDIAEGAEMGLETGSMSGLSCGLYGSVDFGEDYREVTGRLAVPEKLYVYETTVGNFAITHFTICITYLQERNCLRQRLPEFLI